MCRWPHEGADVRVVPKSVPGVALPPGTLGHMPTTTYGAVLRLPGVARLFVVSFIARIPGAMIGVVLTLHVVSSLGRGYGEAGVVVGAATIWWFASSKSVTREVCSTSNISSSVSCSLPQVTTATSSPMSPGRSPMPPASSCAPFRSPSA